MPSVRRAGCLTGALLIAALWVPAGAEEDKAEAEESSLIDSLSLGLRGSMGRAANSKDHDWGPTLSLSLLSSEKSAWTRFGYELEYSYNDAYYELRGDESTEQTRVRSSELKYAKVSLLKLFGHDLKKRLRCVPYVAGGVQYVDSKEETRTSPTEDEEAGVEVRRYSYWAPTWGAGLAFSLGSRTTLALDYENNFEGGRERISRLSLELKLMLFGEPDE